MKRYVIQESLLGDKWETIARGMTRTNARWICEVIQAGMIDTEGYPILRYRVRKCTSS